jgi:hypothetical protein
MIRALCVEGPEKTLSGAEARKVVWGVYGTTEVVPFREII